MRLGGRGGSMLDRTIRVSKIGLGLGLGFGDEMMLRVVGHSRDEGVVIFRL